MTSTVPRHAHSRSHSTTARHHRGSSAHGGGAAADPVITRLVKQDTVPWYKKRNLRRLYLVMVPTLLGVEMTSGFDSSMINGLQAVDAWDHYFNHPRSTTLGLISSLYSLGAVVALPIVPRITDRYGRRHAIVFGSSLIVVGSLLQTAATSIEMFMAARFIMGLGIPFAIVGASSLVGELSYPKERPVLSNLFSAFYFVGSIAASGATFLTYSLPSNSAWRIPSFLQVVPSVLQIAFMPFLPESPRWLISKGRREEAFSILLKYHGEGEETEGASSAIHTPGQGYVPLQASAPTEEHEILHHSRSHSRSHDVSDEETLHLTPHFVGSGSGTDFARAEFAQIEATIELELEMARESLSKGGWWNELFGTFGMRRRMLICMFLGVSTQWSGNGLLSYFLARILENVGIEDNKSKNLINFGISCWALLTGAFIALNVHKFPRRTAYLTCTVLLLIIVSVWTIASARYAATGDLFWGHIVIGLIFLYNPAYSIGFNAMVYTFLVELFPFAVRAKGLSIYQWWVRIASFLNQLLNPIGIAKFGWKYYLTYIAYIIFEIGFIYFLFPETSNRTLEELAFLYEGDDVKDEQLRAMEDELDAEEDGDTRLSTENLTTAVRKRALPDDTDGTRIPLN